ncbi:hypothetical protein [Cochlodiniinecator piscidefendens]|uniref:hypothetical protein n=1 Tax=Cochlodiniinecator piscidefendens TaxID=2715756 RepID=UPI00140752A6|nr:hypothetical protein [Cochlodiniinecator piscidefendens]
MTYKKDDIVIRFSNVAAQPSSKEENIDEIPIKRLVGFVAAKNLFPLFDNAGLAANPRSSRRNSVVDDILNTLNTTPELFRFKSKGILLGTAHYEELQRSRFRLRFEDSTIEGILDGGHNMLAIGLFVLRDIMEDRDWKRIKSWDDMKTQWDDYRKEIEKRKNDFDFLVPVELLVPTGFEDDDADAFMMPLLEVCEARNNNAQLPQEAKSNKQGFYDAIKDSVSPEFSARVEWKPNSWEDETEKRPIKIRDLIALAWIPLNELTDESSLPTNISVSPQNTYRNKAECSKRFEELMSLDEVTKKKQGPQRELKHAGVLSAFGILADLPALYDQIYADFPKAYNANGKRRFASNPIVKIYDPEKRQAAQSSGKDVQGYTSVQPKTPFYRNDVSNNYPEGLIVPLIYGLKGLLIVEHGLVRWAVKDPKAFVERNLSKIAESYQLVMNMAKWDPQKISKDPSSYEFSVREFRNALFEEQRLKKQG